MHARLKDWTPMSLPAQRRQMLLAVAGASVLAACGKHALKPADAHIEDEPAPATPTPCHLALVLSGGGLRGFAHVGVLDALHTLGVVPDLIVGCSAGAIVGGLYAAGLAAPAITKAALNARLEDEMDPWIGWLVAPAARSALIERWLRNLLPKSHIQHFAHRFVAVATRRDDGTPVALGQGDAVRALLASAAVPGVLAPVRVREGELIDGGLSQPLPVLLARAYGAALVIAVDVSFHPLVPAPSGRINSVFHAGLLMSRNLALRDRDAADLLIEPVLPPGAQITLARRELLVASGRQATLASAARIAALVDKSIEVAPIR
jgi:NTE family protein